MNKDELLSLLKQKGVSDKVISAISKVKREQFVPDQFIDYSYEDIPLPLWSGSTISQPSTTAFMLDILDTKQGQKILELGSGSGYVLALMSEMIKDGKIYGIEILKELALKSRKVLSNNSIVEIITRSGTDGLIEFAPFDRIIVSFSCPDKYIPSKLIDQLTDPGILIVPIRQSIFKFEKKSGKVSQQEFPGFVFVPVLNQKPE